MKDLKIICLTLYFINTIYGSVAFAQDAGLVSIQTFIDYRNEAINVLNQFKLTPSDSVIVEPDYVLAKREFIARLEKANELFSQKIADISRDLLPSYALIRSLEKLSGTAAAHSLQLAKERFDLEVKKAEKNYQVEVQKFVYGVVMVSSSNPNSSDYGEYQYCLSVLCSNRLNEDFKAWINVSSAVNRKVNLEYSSMNPISRKVIKGLQGQMEDRLSQKIKLTPIIAINEDDSNFKNLQDQSITNDELRLLGIEAIYRDGLKGAQALYKKMIKERAWWNRTKEQYPEGLESDLRRNHTLELSEYISAHTDCIVDYGEARIYRKAIPGEFKEIKYMFYPGAIHDIYAAVEGFCSVVSY